MHRDLQALRIRRTRHDGALARDEASIELTPRALARYQASIELTPRALARYQASIDMTPRALARYQASIDMKSRARHEARRIARQEEREADQLVGVGGAAQERGLGHHLLLLGAVVAHHIGIDGTRRDCIHADIGRREFGGRMEWPDW